MIVRLQGHIGVGQDCFSYETVFCVITSSATRSLIIPQGLLLYLLYTHALTSNTITTIHVQYELR